MSDNYSNSNLQSKIEVKFVLLRLHHLISLCSTLCLMLSNGTSGTTDLLALVLSFLHCLTRLLSLLEHSVTYKTVLRLELKAGLLVIVDEAESSGLSSSELGAASENDYKLWVSLVHLSDNLLELRLCYVSTSRVDDVDNHLR